MELRLIDVAIGLVATYLVMSIMASAVVEFGSVVFKKRSKDLNIVLAEMLSTGGTNALDIRLTSVWTSLKVASRRKRGVGKGNDSRTPSYLSAKGFADAVIERLIATKHATQTVDEVIASLPDGPLRQRLSALRVEVGDDLVAVKAGLESWFDDTMDRLQGAYKRWSQWILLCTGLVLALALNVSTVRIVDSLWNDATLREAVTNSSAALTAEPCPVPAEQCTPEQKIENAIGSLESLKVPIGWDAGWSEQSGALWTLLGLVPTGLAVVFGAPFWFDLLTRLVVRGGRGVPLKAADDSGSATKAVVTVGANRVAQPFFSQ